MKLSTPSDAWTMANDFIVESVGRLTNCAFVAGGSCICFAKGDPLRLSLQDLVDNLVPCLAAIDLGVPAVLYFQSHEAVLMADVLHFDPAQARHEVMLPYLEAGIRAVLNARSLLCPPIVWIDTASVEIRAALDTHAQQLTKQIPKEALYGIYGAVQKSDYPKGTPEENVLINVYFRNLALYTREFLIDVGLSLGSQQGWLALENEGQGRAMLLAGIGTPGSLTARSVYPVTPNRRMKEMCLGNANHKIELRSTEKQIVDRSASLEHPTSSACGFYRSVFGQLTIPEVMKKWKKSIEI